MTFCLAIRVQEGLVGIADTRVISGSECITAKKVSVYHDEQAAFFVMSSGLRAVRDKALTYFEEFIEDAEQPLTGRLFRVANLLADQIRRVSEEDKESLEQSGFRFNIHALIGGQLPKDREQKLFLIYPEGNWVEIGRGTPYHIIGASGYGKPVLDRTLKYEDPMKIALKVGCLAFDSTRISAADVDFPVDVVMYARNTFQIVEHRFEKADLAENSNWWQERLRDSVRELPTGWMEPVLNKLREPEVVSMRVPDRDAPAGKRPRKRANGK
jgi:putative proteasome-type protease